MLPCNGKRDAAKVRQDEAGPHIRPLRCLHRPASVAQALHGRIPDDAMRIIGLLLALGCVLLNSRIVYGIAITKLLAVAFGLVIALSFVSAPQFIPLAYDAGSVTTGVLSTPVLLALALGVSSVLARRADTLDGFGLLGLASIGPIVVVLLMGWLG